MSDETSVSIEPAPLELLSKLDDIARRTSRFLGLPLDRPGRQTPLLFGAVSEWANPFSDEIQRLRVGIEEICKQRATSPITRSRLRHLVAGVDWRKVK